MKISEALVNLYILQDSITWLNSAGKEDSIEALGLCNERNQLVTDIVEYVEGTLNDLAACRDYSNTLYSVGIGVDVDYTSYIRATGGIESSSR